MRTRRSLLTLFATLVVFFTSATSRLFAASEEFSAAVKQILAETHARSFQEGNLEACVSCYAEDARFFVDNKLVARGQAELLKLYRSLRETDGIRNIQINDFVEIGGKGDAAWALFNYTKEYDLKNRDPLFLKAHQLEGFSTVNVRQYGSAVFVKTDGRWKIQTMAVFDPEIWEPQK